MTTMLTHLEIQISPRALMKSNFNDIHVLHASNVDYHDPAFYDYMTKNCV